MDSEEIIAIEQIAIADPSVQKELAKLELPAGSKVVCDTWIYGTCSPTLMLSEAC